MSLAGLILSILSLAVSIVAAVFAVYAATRSERVLKRLVVYPFRELDRKYSNLGGLEQRLLGTIARHFSSGTATVGLSNLLEEVGDQVDGPFAARKLAEEGWVRLQGDGLVLNQDRGPYLRFLQEATDGVIK